MNSTFFIEALHQYGYAALWLIVFVAAALFLVLFAAIILFVLLMRRIRQERHASQAHDEISASDAEKGTADPNEAIEADELLQRQSLNTPLKQNSGPLPIPD